MTYQDFFNKYNGKHVESEDPNNPFQCLDLAFAYVDFLQIPRETIRHLNAYEVWTGANDLTRKYFTLIPNTPTGVPGQGDLVVFNTVVGPSGHICIANGVGDTNTFKSLDQNWAGHKFATTETHNYNGVLGWLHVTGGVNYEAKYNELKTYVQQIKDILSKTGI